MLALAREHLGVRCPVLVGRVPEVATMTAALTARRGAWITVVGEAGIGKSRLAMELAASVRAQGGLAAVGRCSSVDRATPYRPLAEALLSGARGVARPDGAAVVAPYAAALARFVPHWRDGDPAIVNESPAVLGESLLRVVEWLAGDAPAVLVIDDVHWADDDTLAVCDYLVDHVQASPLVVIATARPDEAPAAVQAVAGRGQTIVVPPLSDADVAEVVARCLGEPPPEAVVRRLQLAAAGLPLLVEDLLDDRAGTASPRFAALVRQRFDALVPRAQRAVVAAAMLGERFDWAHLPASLGDTATNVAADVHAATAAQLLVHDDDGFRFRHALTRDVVLASAPALQRELAPSVAGALQAAGGSGTLARAAELRAELGDLALACRLFEQAATRAVAEGAPEAALPMLERAAALATDRRAQVRVGLARLGHLCDRGRVAEAQAVGTTLLDAAASDPEALRRVRLLLARSSLDGGDSAQAVTHLDQVAAGHGPLAEMLVLQARAALETSTKDRRAVAEHLAHQAVAAAGSEGHPELACEALELAARCARSRSLDDAAASLHRALVVAEEHHLEGRRLRILNELGTVDMLHAADGARLQRAFDAAMAAGAIDVAAGTAVNIAALHAMRGELPAARSAAGRAHAMAMRLGLRPLAAAALMMQALSDGFRGHREAMERTLGAANLLSGGDADLASFAWGAGRGICALVREERENALHAFQQAVQTDAPVGSLDTARGPLLLIRAVAGDATDGDLTAARATATPGAIWSDLWLGYGEAVLRGARDDSTGAVAAFQRADAAAHRHPLFRAVGLRLVAEAALRDGWGEPVAWLRTAEAAFVAGGQDRIATACRTLLARAGAPATRRRGADRHLPVALLEAGVTAREADVLQLIAERLGNKEIAARLFMSPRTVEKHVASLRLKLGATDRAALVRAGHAL